MSDSMGTQAEQEKVFFRRWVNDFLQSLKIPGDLSQALRKAGYDSLHPKDKCTAPVFVNILAGVRRHLFPDLSPAEGYRRIGRLRLAGQAEAGIGGKFWVKMFPVMGPARVIQVIGKSGSSGNNFMKTAAIQEGDRRWRITFRNTGGVPGDFIAGSLEYALELAKTPPERKVAVTNADAAEERFDLEVTW